MEAVIIIPARYASTRYPGKPLKLIRGASGVERSLLERTIIAGRRAVEEADDEIGLFVTTDDERIAKEARRLGVDVIMTSAACRNGTERVAEATFNARLSAEIVVNLQGDAPLTPPAFVTTLIQHMRANLNTGVATPILRCDVEAVRNFIDDRMAGRVGATTVVTSQAGKALYFSKEVIPFTSGTGLSDGIVPIFHHVGLYAYRHSALTAYQGWGPGPLETIEGLEQLRFLENGYPVDAVEVAAPGAKFWELNNPSDVLLIEGYLAQLGLE